MAKWGEGDPRWIVEERPDATNVNNWHCKSVTLIAAKCEITELDKCEGEAVANNRKGKLIFFYEWDIVLKWTGKLEGGEKEAEGTITIPNLSEENDVSEVDNSQKIRMNHSDKNEMRACKINTTTLKFLEKFQCTGEEFYNAMTVIEVPHKKIVQQWRFKKWPAEHYSTVTFAIEQKDDHTEVKVVQTGVPESEAETTKENWERYYWEAMKRTFGFGSFFV
ncbi:Activator of 90 kDa heat shock protein ATPase 2 [Blattella germanica]|nr:Activator of 90 kDa heat shock protein ATPase 2 [Blattella germanica]